jgi:predicted nucleic acid-binding protein
MRYIESSALVAALLESDALAIASIRAGEQRATSALTIAEASRAVLRARLAGRITAQQQREVLVTLQRFARRCHLVRVTDIILAHAGRPFPGNRFALWTPIIWRLPKPWAIRPPY